MGSLRSYCSVWSILNVSLLILLDMRVVLEEAMWGRRSIMVVMLHLRFYVWSHCRLDKVRIRVPLVGGRSNVHFFEFVKNNKKKLVVMIKIKI
jgi:hypothetical protein